ncbi:MAG TPA: branched-chain amino acid ABC transporter permease [Kofleriaceae bacterium]|jgi:branched-chain amino acid transport system permease protein|nr:branched-chain amino acid ABC transporter permease [Kofleriaceae bacterium]
MEGFLHQLLLGLASGSIYGGVALALVMIFKATHHVNFAQGELAMFTTYISWSLIQAGAPYWVAFALTLGGAFLLGSLIQVAIVRRVQHAPVLTVVIVFIGLLIILNSLAGWLFGHTTIDFPSPFPADAWYGSAYFSPHEVGMTVVTLATLALVYAFFRYTRLGLAMRAAALNPASSRLVGIRVDRMLALGWGFASLLGAVAGMMAAPIVFLEPNMMVGILVYAFAAALLGGIENPWGAPIGGFIVGVMENLAGAYVVGTQIKLAVALFIIVAVLVFKPSGLFGRRSVVRV